MQIDYLARHTHLIDLTAVHLCAEWGTLPPWRSQTQVVPRLYGAINTDRAPFCCIALGTDGRWIGTASVRLDELPRHPNKRHWLGEVFIPAALRGQGIGSALVRYCLCGTLR